MLAKQIVNESISRYDKINISQLAKSVGVPKTTIWFPLNTDRPWNADNWLKVMIKLGAIRKEDDKIVIESSLLDRILGVKNDVEIPITLDKNKRS
jgi:hypothetical protein